MNYMLRLKDAPFDDMGGGLLPGVISCGECMNRTGNQPDLFGEVDSADVCTNPECFHIKLNAHYQRILNDAKERGWKVLSKKESAEVFPWANCSARGGYVDLDAPCYDDKKNRNYRKLLKKKLPDMARFVAQDNEGAVKELVREKDAKEALKDLGHQINEPNTQYKEQQKEQRQQEKLRREIINKLTDKCCDLIRADVERSYIRILANTVFNHADFDAIRIFAKRRDEKIKGQDARGFVRDFFASAAESELLGFVFELFLCGYVAHGFGGETMKALVGHYGIDENAIKNEVKGSLKSKPQAKKGRKTQKEKVREAFEHRQKAEKN
jgi:hypothetical protein